jgi:hypothetical protein
LREGIADLAAAIRVKGQSGDASAAAKQSVTSEEIGHYLPHSSELRSGKMDLTKVRVAKTPERKVFVSWCRTLSDNFLYDFKTGTVNRMAYDRPTSVLASLVVEYVTKKLNYEASALSIEEVRYLLKSTCKSSRQRSRVNEKVPVEEVTSDLDEPGMTSDHHQDRTRVRKAPFSDDEYERSDDEEDEAHKRLRADRAKEDDYADDWGCMAANEDNGRNRDRSSSQAARPVGRMQQTRDEDGRSSSQAARPVGRMQQTRDEDGRSSSQAARPAGRQQQNGRSSRQAAKPAGRMHQDEDEEFNPSASGQSTEEEDDHGDRRTRDDNKQAAEKSLARRSRKTTSNGPNNDEATPEEHYLAQRTRADVDETEKKDSRNRARRTEQERLKNTWAAD